MANNEPIDHHYVPQFLLRNFATDSGRLRVRSLAKHGDRAVWKERSIKGIGFEKNLYVHFFRGAPVSVETDVNRNIETPIAESQTWQKIAEGRPEELDASDKPILYALVRHLNSRTPHFRRTIDELEALANDPLAQMEFSAEEREQYAFMKSNPEFKSALMNRMASDTSWQADAFEGALVMVWRSPVALRTGTTPVLSLPAPADPRVRLDGPGIVPTQLVAALSPSVAISVVLGEFEHDFQNVEIGTDAAMGLNRYYIGQFAYFEQMRHVICEREGLEAEMLWARYTLETASSSRMVFRRQPVG